MVSAPGLRTASRCYKCKSAALRLCQRRLRPIPKEIKTRQYSRRYTQDKPSEGSRNLTDLAQRMSRLDPKESPPLTCVHVVKCADIECTAIRRIVAALAKHAGSFGYEISVLFLGDGPLFEVMRDAGVQATIVPWTGDYGDFAGAWRVWSRLRQRRVRIVHLHSRRTAVRVFPGGRRGRLWCLTSICYSKMKMQDRRARH